MTAKEKAVQIRGKYAIVFTDDEADYNSPDVARMSKKIAIIAVDEILSVIKHTFYSKYYKYWESVKQEIEKL